MLVLRVHKAPINPDRLHADLRDALGYAFHGLSFSAGVVTLHLADNTPPEAQAQARALVEAHQPADLTPAQQAARERDALPFFRLPEDELAALAGAMEAADFRREVARAFAHLRDIVRGAA